ncbi:MAG: hypothetical protein HQL10_02615 [Nitrospirae bacterium]|nr:hypothetical protein [Nitrospirota bacterium]
MGAEKIVVPNNPQDKISNDSVKSTIQTNTDIQTPTAAPVPAGTTGVGIDSTMSSNKKVFNIPISHSFSERTAIVGNVPFMFVKYQEADGNWNKSSSIGDISLTLKQRFGDEKEIEYQTLITGKLPSGDQDAGLGSGSYDVGLTQRIIKRIDIFRFIGSGGYIHPINTPKVYGQKVNYGDSFTWMAALDANVAKQLRIWTGLKLSGSVTQGTKIEGVEQQDRLSTVDVTPEVKYFFTDKRALNLGVNIPVSTSYNCVNAEKRKPSLTFGFYSLF